MHIFVLILFFCIFFFREMVIGLKRSRNVNLVALLLLIIPLFESKTIITVRKTSKYPQFIHVTLNCIYVQMISFLFVFLYKKVFQITANWLLIQAHAELTKSVFTIMLRLASVKYSNTLVAGEIRTIFLQLTNANVNV